LAIANPKLAPYGAAAYQLLQKMELLAKLTPKLVTGDNISSTYQYVVSGNAELGFVALSQVYQNGRISSGSAWIIPEKLVPGIKQDAIILSQGKNQQSAEDFMKFLKSASAQNIMQQFGYK
jgi:molybdate transport system substrate-binding protein